MHKNEAQTSFLIAITLFWSFNALVMLIYHFVFVWLLFLLCVAFAKSQFLESSFLLHIVHLVLVFLCYLSRVAPLTLLLFLHYFFSQCHSSSAAFFSHCCSSCIVVLHTLLFLPHCYFWLHFSCNATFMLFLSCYSFCDVLLVLQLCATLFTLQLCVAPFMLQLLF